MEDYNWPVLIIVSLLPALAALLAEARNISLLPGGAEPKLQGRAKWLYYAKLIGLTAPFFFLFSLFMVEFCNGAGQEGQFDTFGHGAWHGAFIGVVVILPVLIFRAVRSSEQIGSLIIRFVFWAVVLALMGGILDATHHWTH